MNKGIIKMAHNVEARDMSQTKLRQMIDPNNKATMTLEEFRTAMASVKE